MSALISRALTRFVALLADATTAVGGASLVAYDATKVYTLGLGKFLNYVFGRTAGEIAAGVTPTNYAYFEGDIRRYGALTAAVDNSAAINAALLVSANGGAAAYIPPGGWAYTSTLNAVLNSCMHGEGFSSVLQPHGCDGITLTTSGAVAGPKFIRDLFISGTGTGANAGIAANMLAASGNRGTGLVVEDVVIQNFAFGVDMVGEWNPTFDKLFLYNNYNGMRFSERSIDTRIVDVSIVKGAIAGAGTQRGIQFVQVGAVRPEDVTLRHAYVYGYDIGMDLTNGLYAVVEHCDFDNCQQTGIRVGTINGGVTIRDSWINVNAAAATIGIEVIAAGSPINEKVLIEGNNITNLTPNAGSIGIKAGANQLGVKVGDNFIKDFETGVRFNANDNGVCTRNTIDATASAIVLDSLGLNYEVGPNTIVAGTPLVLTGTRPVGMSYYASGSAVLPVTGMTAGLNVTYNWVSDGQLVTLSNPSSANGTSNATTMTATGLPVALRPATGCVCLVAVRDSGVIQLGSVAVDNLGVLTYGLGAANAAFAAAGGKGVTSSTFSYITR